MNDLISRTDTLARSFAFTTTEAGLARLRDALGRAFQDAMDCAEVGLESRPEKRRLVDAIVVVDPVI
jgi:hypothetical protein